MAFGIQLPSTPTSQRTLRLKPGTPKLRPDKTILDFDNDGSYVEEEDATYTESINISADEFESDNIDLDDEVVEVEAEVVDIQETTEKDGTSPKRHSERLSLQKFLVKHEIPRKVFHSSIGFVTLYLYSIGMNPNQLLLPFCTICGIIFTSDFLRLRNPGFNKAFVKNFWFIIRDNEVNSYNGTFWYILGIILVTLFLSKDMLVMSAVLLSWADTSASTFGRLYGKYTFQIRKGKSFAGSAASFITGIFSSYLFYGYFVTKYGPKVDSPGEIAWTPETSKLNLFWFSLACGLIASVSEFIDLFGLDDNFTIPVLSGSFLFGLVKLFHN